MQLGHEHHVDVFCTEHERGTLPAELEATSYSDHKLQVYRRAQGEGCG
jgi:hypothetical protein